MTIDEIAGIAGVSKTTVSRVLNNKPDVRPKTRDLIHNIIEAYGYQPNANAAAITKQKINHVGIILPYSNDYIFSNPVYMDVIQGIYKGLDQKGYYLLLCYPYEKNYIDLFRQKRVDGFIMISASDEHKALLEMLINNNIPVVSCVSIEEGNVPRVDVDNYQGGTAVTEYLISLGHKDIAFIWRKSNVSSKRRLEGYIDSMKSHSLAVNEDLIITIESASTTIGYETTKTLLESESSFSAIIFNSDISAIRAIPAIQEKGLKVPEDISIVSFDNIEMSQYSSPPLTAIDMRANERGSIAAEMIIDLIEKKTKPVSRTLEACLIKRKSAGICGQFNNSFY
jgi:DNA-binding LacI/PurR family transcriptional regulator